MPNPGLLVNLILLCKSKKRLQSLESKVPRVLLVPRLIVRVSRRRVYYWE